MALPIVVWDGRGCPRRPRRGDGEPQRWSVGHEAATSRALSRSSASGDLGSMAGRRVDEVDWTSVRSGIIIGALGDLSGRWHSSSRAATGAQGAQSGRAGGDIVRAQQAALLAFDRSHIGRSPSTISREVHRNGGRDRYRTARSDYSTNVPERPCSMRPRRRSSLRVLQRSVEPAAQCGRATLEVLHAAAPKFPNALSAHLCRSGRANPSNGLVFFSPANRSGRSLMAGRLFRYGDQMGAQGPLATATGPPPLADEARIAPIR